MASIRVDREKNRLMVTPEGQADFTVLMKLPARRWMARAKLFVVPASRVNCQHLMEGMLQDLERFPEALLYVMQHAESKAGNRPFPEWYANKTSPFPDQRAATLKCYQNNTWALFMRMGSGKTKSAIDLTTAAFYERVIVAAVVILPLAVRTVWTDPRDGQLAKHSPCPILKVEVDSDFDWTDIPVSHERLTWLFVGIESLSQGRTYEKLVPFIENHKCAVMVDESSRIKNPKALRTQRVVSLGPKAVVKGVMTGTPITKAMLDLFSQFEFLDPQIIGAGDYYAFRNRYAIMGGFKNKKIMGYDHVEELMSLIEPYVYICDKPQGLPQKLFTVREVDLCDEQKDMYRKLKRAEIPQVSVANVLNRVAKLQEIVGGFLREDPIRSISPLTGREVKTQGKIIWELPPDKNPKLIEMHNMIEELGDHQMVVWAKYRRELEWVREALEAHGPCGEMHGGIAPEDRTAQVNRFQDGANRYMAATQQVGGIGHTMVAAHFMMYFSNTHSLEDRLQSEDRIHRIGQDDDCLYIDLIARRTVDIPIQESIAAKKDLDQYVRDKMREASFTLDKLLGEG